MLKYAIKTLSVLAITLLFSISSVSAKETVTVFAAASLTNALSEIGQNYDKMHSDKVVFSFASSSTLARQIDQGAPAQIYLSANQKWMDYLVKHDAVDSKSRTTLLKNTLVLIASSESHINDIKLNSDWNIEKTLKGNRLAVGDPDHVPAGRYAQEALTNLGLWKQAEPLLARANNVRAALALVERNEAPLGIVYATDAEIASGVKTIAIFPESSHKAIEYPMVMVDHKPSQATIDFYHYLQSSAAKTVFIRYGFGVI